MSPAEISHLEARLHAIHEDVVEVKELAAATNGRVRTLELWKAKVEGAKWAVGWVPPLVTSALAATASAVLTALILG